MFNPSKEDMEFYREFAEEHDPRDEHDRNYP